MIASNGTPITVNVIVYELTGVLAPQATFTGRSVTNFGLEEVVDLSATITLSIKPSAAGGIRWTLFAGTGQLSSQDDGTGTFTAPETAESSTLQLEVLTGPSKGQYIRVVIGIVAPSGASEIQTPGTGIHHTYGYWGLGFLGWIRFDPTNVSFARLQFRELATNAVASGYLSAFAGYPHPATANTVAIGDCNTTRGCRVMALSPDEVLSEFIPYPQNTRPFAAGDFLWAIPWQYYTTTRTVNIGTGNHHATSNAAGDATLEKAGAGPFTRNYLDPTTSW